MKIHIIKRNRPMRSGLIKMSAEDRCPSLRCVCGRIIHYNAFDYCPYCGQRLDWKGTKKEKED